jgi:hypothetical protein
VSSVLSPAKAAAAGTAANGGKHVGGMADMHWPAAVSVAAAVSGDTSAAAAAAAAVASQLELASCKQVERYLAASKRCGALADEFFESSASCCCAWVDWHCLKQTANQNTVV